MGARQFSTASQKSVAFIGMGSMGFPMASNLAKNGFKVNGYDLYPNKDAEKNGINVASSVADACRDVDYVVTSLPKNEHVMSTMFDANVLLLLRLLQLSKRLLPLNQKNQRKIQWTVACSTCSVKPNTWIMYSFNKT